MKNTLGFPSRAEQCSPLKAEVMALIVSVLPSTTTFAVTQDTADEGEPLEHAHWGGWGLQPCQVFQVCQQVGDLGHVARL